jgi:hypothetical protein
MLHDQFVVRKCHKKAELATKLAYTMKISKNNVRLAVKN